MNFTAATLPLHQVLPFQMSPVSPEHEGLFALWTRTAHLTEPTLELEPFARNQIVSAHQQHHFNLFFQTCCGKLHSQNISEKYLLAVSI